MAISGLLAVISQPYPSPGAAAPEPRTRDLVGQKSNALPSAPRARCLAGFDRAYGFALLVVYPMVTHFRDFLQGRDFIIVIEHKFLDHALKVSRKKHKHWRGCRTDQPF
ncbi:unnamed protein product [Schistocephalus solidus]|uniref:Transposase n=1 Tax=Schistocephalus solidus TaxID=70667 RepID=A0A183SAE7_SCHSO|nr:unnamed protein product [Schistocephalus solidus]